MFLEKAYKIVRKRDEKINSYFKKLPEELQSLFEAILKELGLEVNEENMLALKKRFLHLREDSIMNLLKQGNFSKEDIFEIQNDLYILTRNFWIKEHEKLINELAPFVGPFYAEILRGVHKIGIVFSKWQPHWNKHIIQTINEELSLEFAGDEAKIMAFLMDNNLLDKVDNKISERCYSVLVKGEEGFVAKTYVEVFEEEVNEAVRAIDELILNLEKLEDEYKIEWILYFNAIKTALLEKSRSEAIKKWSNVDKIWMDIKSPIQVGHPLEYYEDKYRKAVALELDVRIKNPNLKSKVKENIIKMYKKYCKDERLLNNGLSNIEKTQLYISLPATFYGAELNGLFSAQVVPNDEYVSLEKGKKIFAFVDKVYEDIKARPKMALSYEILGKEFMDNFYKDLEDKEKFIKVYDITTIGHEFGHILWVDSDSEIVMNKSGMFKNIEEFKATTGGLMAFFESEDENLIEAILDDTIKRAVSLIAWMEVDEVLPYYIEGLIHLTGLFESGTINFNGTNLEYNYNNYEKLKEWYKKTYLKLADIYLKKEDAKKFLDEFIYKDKNYYPLNKNADFFVRYYYKRYKEIGNKIYGEKNES
ncbi:invasion protein CiaB [Caminibacter mediatlanticus]|uniref:CiaB protein n=1 Tax=Caminibacter mediatlanticus TB-2 TaxID=391592 RepID=A0AAI9AGW0_9BACT|nr:invasion protein CiaB [Caminibacter mediatlanticus]EDM23259.1 CiaB protein [Caminibacter mediatlanticus TB-2]